MLLDVITGFPIQWVIMSVYSPCESAGNIATLRLLRVFRVTRVVKLFSQPIIRHWAKAIRRCVAVCRSVLQCLAVCCSVFRCIIRDLDFIPAHHSPWGTGHSVVCCSLLQSVAVYCSVLQCVSMYYLTSRFHTIPLFTIG